MYFSKIIIAISLLLLISCKNEPPNNSSKSIAEATPVKENVAKTVASSNDAAKTPAITSEKMEEEKKQAHTTVANKEKAMQSKANKQTEINPVNKKQAIKDKKPIIVEKDMAQEAATKINTSADKVAETKKAVANTASIKITESKEVVEKKVQDVKEALPSVPEKVEQPKIIAAASKHKETIEKEVSKPKPTTVNLNLKSLDHKIWDGLLRKYVSDKGKVNYKGFKSDNTLETYLQLLANNPIQDSWSRSEKMAYWINAYNAFTIKLIVDNYPISSITKLHGGKPWDHKWIKLGDKTYTLNEIENKILRPQFKDARIHFAVNCAATSCPPILNRAWTASNLNQNLERQAKLFISNDSFNSIKANQVVVSKIFEWYKEDFGNLIDYLNKYSATKISPSAEVKFMEYDWALNE